MARDIKDLFKDHVVSNERMPENHQVRFLEKLDKALPQQPKPNRFLGLKIAASITVLLGLTFGLFKFFSGTENTVPVQVAYTKPVETKTLGDISPGLKKVEDYYLASINLELSKMTYTDETKELVDSYLEQIDALDKAYQDLFLEFTEEGPSELTINALIDNLKMRLNLLYRLKGQLKDLQSAETKKDVLQQHI
ncbi:hypothetical protein JJL45_13880 [Tamlana sp. s12]|uniref:hypothetical protein n=1 Tax=Tamlana sp. s12 TaxID=1630406 RepID=UPI0007FD0ADE|nr:hypothetical protein [Tamlana sp. s12]OBQ56380.1 hypothetical protein VQ01_03230 [Tamlana sp. s12]QQY81998.1 hypothetical protein JJL45_13880 [Tamlana sp. s12]